MSEAFRHAPREGPSLAGKGKADNAPGDDLVERWTNGTPENKLELIDGRLVICDLEGSRRIAWQLLADYGPPLGLGQAPARLWWQALQEAYHPSPRPTTPAVSATAFGGSTPGNRDQAATSGVATRARTRALIRKRRPRPLGA
jgi:hypothetical protein